MLLDINVSTCSSRCFFASLPADAGKSELLRSELVLFAHCLVVLLRKLQHVLQENQVANTTTIVNTCQLSRRYTPLKIFTMNQALTNIAHSHAQCSITERASVRVDCIHPQ